MDKVHEMTKHINLIVAEDDPVALRNVIGAVEPLVASVSGFNNGLEAWNYYQDNSGVIDLVLTDIQMPVMSGLELIRHIKKVSPKQGVIVLSANADSDVLIELVNIGVDNFIPKPILGARLLEKLVDTATKYYRQELLDKYVRELIKTQKMLERRDQEKNQIIRILEHKMKHYPEPRAIASKKAAIQSQDESDLAGCGCPLENYHECILDDHQHELAELEELIDSGTSIMILNRKIDPHKLYQVASYFADYGVVLSSYHRFSLLGGEIVSISDAITEYSQSGEDIPVDVFLNYLESFVFTLRKWRAEFLEGRLKDPNEYDNSMLSDIQTIRSVLTNRYEEGEIEFF